MLKYALLFCLLFPTAAFADAIDGSWCSASGHVDIEGPKITLSTKSTTAGQYSRHQFLYTVPEGEEHAGDKVYMQLMGEENMTSYTVKDSKAIDPVDWKRCAATS